jgi:ribosomal protein S18 acetylase RimI-like enzyme
MMAPTGESLESFEIWPARPDDDEALLQLWHAAWHDAHALLVPEAVLAFRTPAHFRSWLQQSDDTRFVVQSHALDGFVSVDGSEVKRLYVTAAARGSGIARALLAHAEQRIRYDGHQEAELFCTDGNTRAQRFYEREGWQVAGTFNDALWVPSDITTRFVVQTRRYQKTLTT